MANNQDIQSLAEQIRFAKQRITAYRHVLNTYDRQKAEIADERRQLDDKERHLDVANAEAPESLTRAQADLDKLMGIQRQREAAGNYGNTGRSKLMKLMARRRKMQAKLAELDALIAGEEPRS